MSFGHAIYYPHINLTNKNWLKYALLFWDKISRIVPATVSPCDSEEVIKIRSEIDFIQDYHPESWDTSSAANKFFRTFRGWIDNPEFLHYYRHRFPEIFEMEMSLRQRKWHDHPDMVRFLGAVAREHGTYIHVQKLDLELKEYLYLTGVAIPGENQWEDWVKIDGELGLLYMTYLASSIGEQTRRPIVTDYNACFAGSSVLLRDIEGRHSGNLEYGLGNLLIASYAPKDMNAVTIDSLLEFRKKYDNERLAFFEAVAAICRDVPTVENEDQLKDALNHHGKILKKQTNDLKNQLEGMRIEPVIRFIGISIPTACTSMIEYIPDSFKPLIIGGGVILGFASAYKSYANDKESLQDNPLSYLLSLHAELDARSFLRKLSDNIQGITRWRGWLINSDK
ncbi:MAG: DUF6236 family protein [Sedimentisphaerales bacterium]|jgi:hypothetical protein